METVEAAVESVREQMQSLVAKRQRRGAVGPRVRLRKLDAATPCWRITARVGHWKPTEGIQNLSFTPHVFVFGNERIVLSDRDALHIVSAGVKGDTLTLCVARAQRVLAESAAEIARAEDVLETALNHLSAIQGAAARIAATRAVRAISRLIGQSTTETLAEAASAPNDMEVLVRALGQPTAIEALKVDDPLAPARLRGFRERERLLEVEGGTWSVEAVRKHLNLARQSVNHRRKQGMLIGLDAGRHGFLYPAWQFAREGTVPGLEAVLGELRSHEPWMQHLFMVSPNARLGNRTPLEILRSGRIEDVLNAARTFGEHGAA